MADIDYTVVNQVIDRQITKLLDTLVNNLPLTRADAVRLVSQRIQNNMASYTLGAAYLNLGEKG